LEQARIDKDGKKGTRPKRFIKQKPNH
jgi:hypothetical protein